MNLVEVQKELVEVSEHLHTAFEEAGDEMDYSKITSLSVEDGYDVSTQISKMNTRLTDLGKRRDDLGEARAVKDHAAGELEAAGKIKRLQHPTSIAPGGRGEEKSRPISIGDSFVKSNAYQAAVNHSRGYVELPSNEMTAKDFLTRSRFDELDLSGIKDAESMGKALETKTTFSTTAGWDPEDTRIGRLVLDAQRGIDVIDAIPLFETQQSTVLYMEETTFTSAAAERAEAAAYAESTLALTQRSSEVRSIGTSLPVTDEQLEDVPQVRDYLNNRLIFMVRQKLDANILTGSGVAPILEGTLNVTGINTQAKGADPVPDAIFKGITAVRSTGRAEPNVAIFHPNDWQTVRLLRTSDGIYVWGSPADAGPERIWGLPVIQSTAETENTAIVGDYARFSGLFMRRGVVVEVGLDSDDFTKGIQTLRAGLRVALVHFRPAAFTEVTGI